MQALANFTWINNVTIGAGHCRFACADEDCLARHEHLPFPAISLEGRDPAIVRGLAGRLLEPDQFAYTLASQRLVELLDKAVVIVETQAEWQMIYRGDPTRLHAGAARPLRADDLPAMLELAAAGEAMVFGPESLARGEFFGIFAGRELAAMGGVQTRLPGYAEIGSIVTHPQHRRQGYATQVVAALIRHLLAANCTPILCLFHTNHAARALYERIGFDVINGLFLSQWRLA